MLFIANKYLYCSLIWKGYFFSIIWHMDIWSSVASRKLVPSLFELSNEWITPCIHLFPSWYCAYFPCCCFCWKWPISLLSPPHTIVPQVLPFVFMLCASSVQDVPMQGLGIFLYVEWLMFWKQGSLVCDILNKLFSSYRDLWDNSYLYIYMFFFF